MFAYSREEGQRAIDRLVREIADRDAAFAEYPLTGSAPRAAAPPVPVMHRPVDVVKVIDGVVTFATVGGSEVEIAPGWTGWLVRRRRDGMLHVSDHIEVLVTGYDERGPLLERPPRSRQEPAQSRTPLNPPAPAAPRPGPPRRRRANPQPATARPTAPAQNETSQEVRELRRLLGEAEEDREEAEGRAVQAQEEAARAIRDIAYGVRPSGDGGGGAPLLTCGFASRPFCTSLGPTKF